MLLLAGLFHLLPPLLAEKILASVYVLGFVYAYRYFLRSLGRAGQPNPFSPPLRV